MPSSPILARICWGRYLDKPQEERYILENLLRQTPGGAGRWGDVQFTIDPVEKCDFLLLADLPTAELSVTVPPQNVWSFTIEPPNEFFWKYHLGFERIARTYTSATDYTGRHLVNAQVPINWHIGLSYDELAQAGRPEKSHRVCCITSALQSFAGHKRRLDFVRRAIEQLPVDLYGRGIREVPRKWDAIAQYDYVIVVENFRNGLYWSEKIADAFLGYCMPIYYGCTNIADYFPAPAVAAIDIEDPHVFDEVRALIASDARRERDDAIVEARRRVLHEQNLFAFFAREIASAPIGRAERVTIPRFAYSI